VEEEKKQVKDHSVVEELKELSKDQSVMEEENEQEDEANEDGGQSDENMDNYDEATSYISNNQSQDQAESEECLENNHSQISENGNEDNVDSAISSKMLPNEDQETETENLKPNSCPTMFSKSSPSCSKTQNSPTSHPSSFRPTLKNLRRGPIKASPQFRFRKTSIQKVDEDRPTQENLAAVEDRECINLVEDEESSVADVEEAKAEGEGDQECTYTPLSTPTKSTPCLGLGLDQDEYAHHDNFDL
jgi:hypothetical protein